MLQKAICLFHVVALEENELLAVTELARRYLIGWILTTTVRPTSKAIIFSN